MNESIISKSEPSQYYKKSETVERSISELSKTDQMKFATVYQIRAYEKFGLPLEISLLMDDIKNRAYETGKISLEQALQIQNRNHLFALAKGIPIDIAIQFSSESSIEALKIGKDISFEDALSITSPIHLKALSMGCSIEEAAQFDYPAQIDALEKFNLTVDNALKFVYPTQVEALSHGLNISDALKFVYPSQITKLKSGFDVHLSLSSAFPALNESFNHDENFKVAGCETNVEFHQGNIACTNENPCDANLVGVEVYNPDSI